MSISSRQSDIDWRACNELERASFLLVGHALGKNEFCMPRPIPRSRFVSADTVRLARELLGERLVLTDANGMAQSRRITETEAYDGPEDLACHASKGRTARTEAMFEPGGQWYVYLVYGMHEMLNLVTGPDGYPAAILIRSVEGIAGPGRLTKRLGIDRRFNRMPAAPLTGLHLEAGYPRVPDAEIEATPRIGIDYAGPDWSQRLYRFVWRPPAVSR